MTATPAGRRLRRVLWPVVIVVAVLAVLAYQAWFRTTVSLTSDPTGAHVRIDGRPVGLTPLQGVAVTPGLHKIEVRHSHFAVHQRQLQVGTGDHVNLHVGLDRGLGELLVFSNPKGAWVEVDGRRHDGRTPLLVRVPSGRHQVALGMAERREATQEVVVEADRQQTLRVDLNMDPHGSLSIVPVPADASVSLPDSGVAYEAGMRLPVGEYRVRVASAGYVSQELRLEVRYGDNAYPVTLEQAFASLVISTEPSASRVRVRYRERYRERSRAGADAPLAWHDYRSGMQVPVGTVEIRASALGRRSVFRRLRVPPSGARVAVTLETMQVRAGERFRDPREGPGPGPEVVVVPPGAFVMGSDQGPPSERPARHIVLTEPFAVSVTEVTAGEYRQFAAATGRRLDPKLADVDASLPATHVTFADAVAYTEWLSAETGKRYRLPSEAEWEYVARAGANTEYFFGDDPNGLCRFANVADQSMESRMSGFDTAECDDGFVGLAPVASFPANAYGLHDVHGNVAEWVLECGMPAYADGPGDGTPLDEGLRCPTHGVRGGSWDGSVTEARIGKRRIASSPGADRGFRILREL